MTPHDPPRRTALRVALLAAVLAAPAVHNGFPLVFSDTGTYLTSGYELLVPRDRPLTYGLWLRLLTGLAGPWAVVVAQSLLVAWLVDRVAVERLPTRWRTAAALGGGLILTGASAAGLNASTLMPDSFTAVLILATARLVSGPWLPPADAAAPPPGARTRHRVEVAWLLGLVVVAAMMHLSHLVLLGLLAGWVLLDPRPRGTPRLPRARLGLLAAAVAAGLAVPALHAAAGRGASVAAYAPLVLLGRVHDAGVLEPVLDAHCPESGWTLCDHRGALPSSGRALIWDADTPPVHGTRGWPTMRDEAADIALASLGHPVALAAAGARDTARQLLAIRLDDGLIDPWYRDPASPPAAAMARFLPGHQRAYQSALQNGDPWGHELDLTVPRHLQTLLLGAACLALAVVGVGPLRRRLRAGTRRAVGVLLAGVVGNAAVCATVANVAPRLQTRVAWLLAVAAVLVVIDVQAARRSS